MKNISLDEIRESSEKYIFIDIRERAEYEKSHIEGAINIPYSDYDFDEQIDEFSKNENYIMYCKKGICSLKAIEIMKEYGFKNLYNLENGFREGKR